MKIKTWWWLLVGFGLWGFITGAGTYAWFLRAGNQIPWLPFHLNYTISWLFWPVCMPLILAAGKRFNLHHGPYVPAIAVHVLLSVSLATAQTLFFVFTGVALWVWLGEWDVPGAWGLYSVPGILYQRIPATVPVYWMV